VSSVLGSLGNVRFSDTRCARRCQRRRRESDLRTFKLTTFDNKTVTVALGRKPERKS